MSSKENKSFKIENHIGIYDGFILDSDCDKAIKLFEERVKFKKTFNRMQSEKLQGHLKMDEATDFHYELDVWQRDLQNIIFNFDICLKNYETHTSIKEYIIST